MRLSRAEMPPEQRDRERRRQKQADYLRLSGFPVRVDPGPAMEHARYLKRRGMSGRRIADLAGVSETVVYDLARGYRPIDKGSRPIKYVDRVVAEAILGVRYTDPGPVGALIEATGTRRRIQALILAGWPVLHISREADVGMQCIQRMTDGAEGIRPGAADRIARSYDRLLAMGPAAAGASAQAVVRAQSRARRLGYAPFSCWDPDTIDDPQALPEWTGVCGSSTGLWVHYRDRILPACPPCLAAGKGNGGIPTLNPDAVAAARQRRGLSQVQLAELLGVDKTTPHHWESGRSRPQSRAMFDQLLAILDVSEEEVAA